MVLESACIPIPSEVTMLFGGALANATFVATVAGSHQHLNFLLVGLMGTLGNLLGSWIAYAVGRIGGRPLIDRWGRFILLKPHEIDRAEAWFVVRTFISLPAGVAEMPLGTFSVYTLAGCLPWTFALAGIGYAVGSQWDTVAKYFKPATYAIAALILIAISWWVLRRLRAQKRDSAPL
ncbi:MAG: DedA family protein [Actinobacteria bacterium]|nr:MAG: DedA family protein [Actinomycetota bacterium]